MNINQKAEYYWLKMLEVVPEDKRFQFEDDASRMIITLKLDKSSQTEMLYNDIYNDVLRDIQNEIECLSK